MVEAQLEASLNQAYEHGFVTDVAEESFAPGLDESVIRRLSKMKNEPDFVLAFRLEAFRHWQTMTPPDWAKNKNTSRSTFKPSVIIQHPVIKRWPKESG